MLTARQQAARGAWTPEAPWDGPWTVQVWAETPAAPGAQALAAGLGVPARAWQGGRPAVGPGTVAALWIPGGADAEALRRELGLAPGAQGPQGSVVVVLGGGEAPWREEAAATLPWAGVGVVDPVAETGLLGVRLAEDPPAAEPGAPAAPSLLGAVAAARLGAHYSLPVTPPAFALPELLAAWLGAPDPALRAAADPRVRAEAVRRQGPGDAAEALARDPEAPVRLAVAATTLDPQLLARLAGDPEPLVRARAVDRAPAGVARAALGDGSSLVRVVAADRLARLALAGDPEAGPALGPAAESPDAYVRWKAAWGLSATPSARPALEALLGDVDSDVRRQAARSLGALRDPAALPALVAALDDPNSFVRRWAAEALGALDDPAALAPLRRAAADPTTLVAAAAAHALTRRGEPASAPHYRPPAPPRSARDIAALAASDDATARKDLCKYLAGLPDHRGALEALAGDPDPEVRKSAVEALGWDPAALPTLGRALADPDPDVRITALDGLRRSGGSEDPLVLALLDHADAEIRLRAAEALAAHATRSAAAGAALAARAGDADERVRAAVVGADPGLLDPAEPALLVRYAAGAGPGDPEAAGWVRGLLVREDELLHERFSWNAPADRPPSHRALRPPVVRAYGHPDRG
ncbi:HEAT repeat domain-containing protein [Myxococcota bacterium]|nr:HEAT repeat domain-containing protein [Myxococcota bacterium]